MRLTSPILLRLHGGIQQTQSESFGTHILAFFLYLHALARVFSFRLDSPRHLCYACKLRTLKTAPLRLRQTLHRKTKENKGLLHLLFEDTVYSLIDMYALPS